MYKIIESKSYIKALSNLKRSGDKAALDNLKIIVDKLSKGEKLPQKFKDHQLHGAMSDKRDCHIKGDLVLIYQVLNNNLYLLDISNHANLFDSYNLSEGKRKKRRKKGAFGWFGSLNPNAGNPEYNAAFFNSTFSSDGSSGVSVNGGLGEAVRDINDPETQSLNITNKNKSVKNMKNRRLRPVMEAGPHAEQMAKNRYNELQDRYKKLEDECDSCNNASREIELQIEMSELSDEIEQLKKDWGYALDLNESINIREYLNDLDKEDYRDLVNMYESANLTPKNKLKILEAIKNRDNNKVVKLVELYYNGVEDSDSFVRFTLDEDSKNVNAMNTLDSINKYFKSLFSDSVNNKNEKINKIKGYYNTSLYESRGLNEVYPQKNETKSDFINRFMRVTAKEYPDVKQRYAIALSYWNKKNLKEDFKTDLDLYIAGGYSIKDFSEDTQDFINSHTQITTWPLYRFDSLIPKNLTLGSEIQLDGFKSFSRSEKGRDRVWEDIQENEKDTSNYCLLKTLGKVRYFDIKKYSSNTNYSYQDEVLAGGWFKIIKIDKWKGVLQYTVTQSNDQMSESYLDPEGKFWDYRTKEISGNQYIDTTRNEIRWVDDMLEDPEYYREKKGYISKIIEMSPEEYFEVCAELFGTSIETQKRQIAADTGVLDNLTQVIKKYKKRFPIPFINIKDRTQEGRHRMYVLGELLGWDKKFPVLIIQDVNNKRV